jgi:hypothetical protein
MIIHGKNVDNFLSRTAIFDFYIYTMIIAPKIIQKIVSANISQDVINIGQFIRKKFYDFF